MMFFLNFANRQGKVHHEEFVAIAKKHNIPTLIDAAADVPPARTSGNTRRWASTWSGFSGGKGLRGPQSAGLAPGT